MKYRTILLAYNGSKEGRRALLECADLAGFLQAETHLLVIPERHVETFREIREFPADEMQEMLEFVADTAQRAGLEDYRVIVNVGRGGGQTVFHLHWHVLGGVSLPGFE